MSRLKPGYRPSTVSLFAPNVGRLDAVIRIVLGVGILIGMVAMLRATSADWALTLLIHPAILTAYLLMTAVARNDIFYHFMGWSTRRAREEPTRYHMRLTPPAHR